MDKRKREDETSSSKKKKKGKGNIGGEGERYSKYVTFNELEFASQEFMKMSIFLKERVKTLGHMEREMERSSKIIEGISNLAPGVQTKMDSGLKVMRSNLGGVVLKSMEIKDLVEDLTSEMQERMEDMGKKVEKWVKEAHIEKQELSWLRLRMTNKAKELEDKALEIRLRIKAMQSLINCGFEERDLCRMQWATHMEVYDGVLAISRLKLADAATSIAADNQRILDEEGHVELCKGIPVLTMNETYRQNRDDIVAKFSSPQSFLHPTQPYKAYKRELEEGKELQLSLASEFTAQGREASQKLVMVRNEEEYMKVGERMGPLELTSLIIPALPGNSEMLKEAIDEGFKVLLYLERESCKEE